MLYLICAYDYIFDPKDKKIEGLHDLFIARKAPIEINVSSTNRDRAVSYLTAPTTMLGAKRSQRSRKKRRMAWFPLLRQGGAMQGGVANYNLTTKAIEATLPECFKQVSQAVHTAAGAGSGSIAMPRHVTKQVSLIADYWGAGVYKLGIR
ncbi:MAG: hypothetical protein AAGD86_13555 [Pseudomonadota bacterium]